MLAPALVVDSARDTTSPLHPCFTWDDTLAAEKYRENQARQVIRSIRVISVGDSDQATMVRCFVNVEGNDEEGRRYVATTRLVDDEQLFEQVRVQFLKELHAFEKRYAEILAVRDLLQRVRLVVENVTNGASAGSESATV